MEVRRLKRPIRIGYWRHGVFKPAATLGVSSDGGIFVAPAKLRDFSWTYGVAERRGSIRDYDHVTTGQRPKLHYHASGRAFVTLTGTDLPRRELRLRPIASIQQSQIISLTIHRTWELASRKPRPNDLLLVHQQWPSSGAFAISVIDTSGLVRSPHPELAHIAPVDLLKDDDSTLLVDLGFYVPNKVLALKCLARHDTMSALLEPSITVAALPRERSAREPPRSALALWTSNVANPVIAHTGELNRVTRSKISAIEAGSFITKTRQIRS